MSAWSSRWAGGVMVGGGGTSSAFTTTYETNVSGTFAVDPANGAEQTLTVTDDVTLSFSGFPSSGDGREAAVRVNVIMGGSGSYTVTLSGITPFGDTITFPTAVGEMVSFVAFTVEGDLWYSFDAAAVNDHGARIAAWETFRGLPSVGEWWHPLAAGFASGAISANNQMRSGPVIDVPSPGWSFDGFAFAWGTTAAAITGTVTMRVGFYTLVDRRKPGTLVAEFTPSGGETDHQASGTPSTGVIREVSCSTLTLPAGSYVLCCAFNGDMNANHLINASWLYRYRSSTLTDLWNASGSAQTNPCWTVSSVTGAMPASPTWAVANQAFPRILLHRSA